MKSLRRFLTRLGNFTAGHRYNERLREEIEEHISLQMEDNLRAGMSREEARRQAILKFGAVEAIREDYQDERGMLFFETLLQDSRYALRMLAKSPAFTVVAILTLALGIGANTAIFSVIDAVMFRSLPVEDPQHLVIFSWTAHQRPKHEGGSSYGDCQENCSLSVPFFQQVSKQANIFSGVAAFAGPLDVDFSGNGPASISPGEFVSGDFFSTVGLKTVLGRPLAASDDSPSAPPVIVLNYSYWQRAFGAEPSVIGRTIRLNTIEAVIVGVASSQFSNLTPGKTQDFFMPLSLSSRIRSEWWGKKDRLSDAAIWWVVIMGRLKPAVSIGQAQAAVSTLFRNETLHGTKPLFTEADAPAIHLLPAREGLNGESNSIKPMLNLIMTAVSFVLLIACANVAGLILARSATRQKELAMRQALGARPGRIARQLITESVLLSSAGGALGVLVAVWGVSAITKLISSGSNGPFSFVVAPDWRVLTFTISVTLITGILSGLAPTWRSANIDLTPSLRENASSVPDGAAQGGQRFRLGDALVVMQVALSIVVLIGAGLLVRTLHNLQVLHPGFDTQNVLLFGINPTLAGYKDREISQLYRNLQQRFEALPGVTSVSYSEEALLSGSTSGEDIHLDGAPPKSNVNIEILPVGPDFFSTMHIPLLAGREFTTADFDSAAATHTAVTAAQRAINEAPANAGNPAGPVTAKTRQPHPALMPVAPVPVMINALFARKFFPNQNPLGKHMGNAEHEEPATVPQPGYFIVGIVGDTKYRNLRHELLPTMYLPLVGSSAHFELRTASDPNLLVQLVRGTVSAADSNLPLFDIHSQSEQIKQSLYKERLMSRLFSFFALLALVLACTGLYGLLSYDVAKRTRELGIRMALGAQRGHLVRMVARQGILLVLIGAAIGIGVASGITRLMASMLYNVRPSDTTTFAVVVILLTLVGLIACCIPALRAIRVDPIVALRSE